MTAHGTLRRWMIRGAGVSRGAPGAAHRSFFAERSAGRTRVTGPPDVLLEAEFPEGAGESRGESRGVGWDRQGNQACFRGPQNPSRLSTQSAQERAVVLWLARVRVDGGLAKTIAQALIGRFRQRGGYRQACRSPHCVRNDRHMPGRHEGGAQRPGTPAAPIAFHHFLQFVSRRRGFLSRTSKKRMNIS